MTVNKSFLSPADYSSNCVSKMQAANGQKEKRPQRKYFFEENGRLMMQVSDFTEKLEYQDFLSEREKISAAFLLGEIFGINGMLGRLDIYDKAIKFFVNDKNVNEFSNLVDVLENLYYSMVNGNEKDSEDFLFELVMLVDSFKDFASSAIRSIKTKTPF